MSLIQVGGRWVNTDRIIGIEETPDRIDVYLDQGMKWTFTGAEISMLKARLGLDATDDDDRVTEAREITHEFPRPPTPESDDRGRGDTG